MSDVPSIVLQDSGVARGTGAPGMAQGFVLSPRLPPRSLNGSIEQQVMGTAA